MLPHPHYCTWPGRHFFWIILARKSLSAKVVCCIYYYSTVIKAKWTIIYIIKHYTKKKLRMNNLWIILSEIFMDEELFFDRPSSSRSKSWRLVTRNIPLPWFLPEGLHIQISPSKKKKKNEKQYDKLNIL